MLRKLSICLQLFVYSMTQIKLDSAENLLPLGLCVAHKTVTLTLIVCYNPTLVL